MDTRKVLKEVTRCIYFEKPTFSAEGDLILKGQGVELIIKKDLRKPRLYLVG